MPLIDKTYFLTGVARIAGVGTTSIDTTVAAYIAQYEPDFLIKAMGYALYDEFINNQSEARFVSLINGGTYTDRRGKTQQYKGLKYTLGTSNYSMIANYVYWNYLRDGAVQIGTTGTATAKTENADRVAPIYKQTIAWNDMVEQVRTLHDYLYANADTYPEYSYENTDCDLVRYQNNMNI